MSHLLHFIFINIQFGRANDLQTGRSVFLIFPSQELLPLLKGEISIDHKFQLTIKDGPFFIRVHPFVRLTECYAT